MTALSAAVARVRAYAETGVHPYTQDMVADVRLVCDAAERAGEDVARLLEKARQLASIANDWNLYEVEIDLEMVTTRSLEAEFAAALKACPRDPCAE